MGLRKAYDELTDNPEFSDGLTVSTGQAIKDGSGTERVQFSTNFTRFRHPNGDSAINAGDGVGLRLYAQSNTPLQIYDQEGDFTAVQYDTDPDAGVLRTPNASIVVQSSQSSTNEGLNFDYDGSNSFITSVSGGTSQSLIALRDSLIDISKGGGSNLRLATGQAIEGGGGTDRVILRSDGTDIQNQDGLDVLTGRGDSSHKLHVWEDTPFSLTDHVGSFEAFEYNPDPSVGTLELTNAQLNIAPSNTPDGNRAVTIGARDSSTSYYIDFINGNSEGSLLRCNNGELEAFDDSGNKTTLT